MTGSIRAAIAADHPEFAIADLDPRSWKRLERLAAASPLYGQMLQGSPELCRWLEDPSSLAPYGKRAFRDAWLRFSQPAEGEAETPESALARLRRWRRRMSLRIAYRSVNGLASEPTTVSELSLLAEFCLGQCLDFGLRRWSERLGAPWDDDNGRPARFCVLAMGKLGGGELNFSSDIDLIYCYEGDGFCRRGGEASSTTTVEFFTRVAETVTTSLTARTADGFLFRVDVRLRPEGAWSPLVRSLSAVENYYSTAGQTWERLALIKGRPVAGDLALGAELLDDLHSFRYPRRPPPSLLAEVAAMKDRTEREIVGAAALERDIKRGRGGIREVEFIAQSLQLLHAGRYPFLQTHATAAALEGLARYNLLLAGEARFLIESYWELRRIENRLQMRDESQTHALPEDAGELSALAGSLGFESAAVLQAELSARRRRVHAIYSGLFSDRPLDPEFEMWWEFFTTPRVPPAAAARIERWFGAVSGGAEALRLLACGDHRLQITPNLIVLFQHLAVHFDAVMPELARPLETFARLDRCAERFGTRRQFLENCSANPQFFRVLALVCDRSGYGVELLCAHPEILEEVLRPEMLRRRKQLRDLKVELSAGPEPFASWLWLYVRAEQMRYAIGELLGFLDLPAVQTALTRLADAVLHRLDSCSRSLIVALGKYGGSELTFGSDLDLVFLAAEGEEAAAAAGVEEMRRLFQAGNPLGPTFPVDLRLRPHGEAGPLVTTLSALAAYHRPADSGGHNLAQTWEKQILIRARVVAGPAELAAGFRRWVDRLLFDSPLSDREQIEIWAMRERIERERDSVIPPERAFKTGPGGLIDIEFLAQTLQLRHGHDRPEVRQTGTRAALRALADAGFIPEPAAGRLLENFDFLKRIEFALRRDNNQAVSVLGAEPADREALARWIGFTDECAFWTEHVHRMHETRALVQTFGFLKGTA